MQSVFPSVKDIPGGGGFSGFFLLLLHVVKSEKPFAPEGQTYKGTRMNAQTKELAQFYTDFPDGDTQLDTIATTGRHVGHTSYRAFLVDSCRKDMDWNRLIYHTIDAIERSTRTDRYDSCRDYAFFVRHKISGEVRVQASACKLRWCPLCIRTKRFFLTRNVAAWTSKLKKPKLLTFTLKHKDVDLKERIIDLYRFFRNVRRTKWFKKNVRGGLWFFQVTKSKTDGLWHPHIHCLVDSNFLPKEKLSELWELVTGDSRIVDIRAVKDVQKTADYVARYIAAPCRLSDFSVDDAIEIVQTLNGRRICGTWGTGRDCSLKVTKPDDWFEWEKIGLWSQIWNDKFNPDWCRKIRKCYIDNAVLEYRPPPNMNTVPPWMESELDIPEPFGVTQLEFNF